MKNNVQQIINKFAEFLLICIFLVLATAMVYLDVKLWGRIPTESFVEFTQEVFIMASSIIFGILAYKKEERGLWLVSGFLGCMFIRELDEYFDILFHGSWFYFAVANALFAIFLALRKGLENALASLAKYMTSKYFITMSCGMAIVLVYSRLIGMKLIWKLVMQDNFSYYVKNVIEEGTELIGYSFILVATLQYAWSLIKKNQNEE